ncbi:MAG: hypothetical protein ACOYMP_12620 [Nodosilinea sp.]
MLDSRVNLDQMLSLIDSILPFEACLFYQIIPLSIESSHLNLGMVNPKDLQANDYARRQVSYIHYSVVAWPVTSDWHRQMLSKYLSYSAKSKQRLRQGQSNVVDTVLSSPLLDQENGGADERLTYIVDSPEKIPLEDTESRQIPSVPTEVPPSPAPTPVSPPLPESALSTSEVSPLVPLELEVLTVPTDPLAEIHRLSPKALLAVLLHQVLAAGIGRLYFEHRPPRGRVVCSQDGQVRSILEDLEGTRLQEVINALKQLTAMPTMPANGSRQTETQRLYGQEPILLRLRVMPNDQGENATLQILRGAALRFYQKQQISELSRDALILAQQLQNRLQLIGQRSSQKFMFETPPLDTLVTLNTLLNTMASQTYQLVHREQKKGN